MDLSRLAQTWEGLRHPEGVVENTSWRVWNSSPELPLVWDHASQKVIVNVGAPLRWFWHSQPTRGPSLPKSQPGG